MARVLSEDNARLLRLQAQGLITRQTGSPAGAARVVKHLCGVQAQEAPAAALALRARCAGLTEAHVEQARGDKRTIVRTWCMRGTLHLVSAQDAGWLLALLGPRFIQASRGRRAQLGLDDEAAARAIRALKNLLGQHGPLTRAEIVEQLAQRDIRLAGQARPHLLSLASLQGLICHGPMRGREPTYVLLADWLDPGQALPSDKALTELARRYLAAYAPARPEDFAAWSGLSLADARAAWQHIANRLAEVSMGDGPAWMLKAQARQAGQLAADGPIVRLAPGYDPYLLGYRGRDLVIAAKDARRIHPGGGLLHPAVLVNGRAVGTWKVERRRSETHIVVEPFERIDPDVHRRIELEADDIAHFLGTDADLSIAP